jgi:hypothetical protein
MNITEQQSREAFEKWGKLDSLHLVDFRRTEQGVGRYKDQSTGLAWIVWQAALKFAEEQQASAPTVGSADTSTIDPGIGWRLLVQGEPLCEGDGFLHTGFAGEWLDYKCRPDLFRGEGNETAHTWPWRRKLPAPPAEEWVDLSAEDVPPGSYLRFAGHTLTWEAIIGTDEDGVWDSSNELVTWEQLFEEREILRPGQDWQHCKKLKTPTP